jgi:hypothetical protein
MRKSFKVVERRRVGDYLAYHVFECRIGWGSSPSTATLSGKENSLIQIACASTLERFGLQMGAREPLVRAKSQCAHSCTQHHRLLEPMPRVCVCHKLTLLIPKQLQRAGYWCVVIPKLVSSFCRLWLHEFFRDCKSSVAVQRRRQALWLNVEPWCCGSVVYSQARQHGLMSVRGVKAPQLLMTVDRVIYS